MAKQVIVMRKDLNMTKGKMVAQGSHASLGVILSLMDKKNKEWGEQRTLDLFTGTCLNEWLNGTFTKICLYVNSEEELISIYNKAKEVGLPVVLIEDAGLTMFHDVKTKTCLAIGPDKEEEIDKITGHLKLL